MRKVFIGFDPKEKAAFAVAQYSLMRHASVPVAVTPLILRTLPMTRSWDNRQSTEFSFSRFLVPYLCNYQGWALFMDCDMMFRADVEELFSFADDRYAVMVVKHDYEPKTDTKFLGHVQTKYPRKNWSSVMLFNCARCTALTKHAVNTMGGPWLHQFEWADEIGELPVEWNHLVGEYDPNPDAKLVHWTLGGPYFQEYFDAEFAAEWWQNRDRMLYAQNRQGSEV